MAKKPSRKISLISDENKVLRKLEELKLLEKMKFNRQVRFGIFKISGSRILRRGTVRRKKKPNLI